MKEDNFILSEKIIELADEMDNNPVIHKRNVKEFIKKVIEVAQSDWTKKERIEWIKKLAGDALI